MLKKGSIRTVSMLLTAALAFAGCSAKEEGKAINEKVNDSGIKPAGTFPIVDKKVTLKVMVKGNALVEDFATNDFTKWYEEKTNVHIEWEVIPEKNAQEKLNVVLASGDYPDVIMDMNINPTQQMIYGDQGVFVALNDLIDKYGLESKKMFAEVSGSKELISAPNGKIYSLPQVNQCYHCSMPQKMWIYKPWLDKLGLLMPTTTDEFYQVLKAFKEKDPNGNGKMDEIPLAGVNKGNVDLFLMNAFIYNTPTHLQLKDGKVDSVFNKPEWKEGLKYMNRLYTEKLLSPESFTQDGNQFKQMGENPGVPILGAGAGLQMGVFTQNSGSSGRWLQYEAVPPLKGPGGIQVTPLDPFGITQGKFVITNKAKYPDVAFRWAEGLYNREVTLRSVFGRQGTEWDYAKQGEIGINGQPAIWKRIASFGQVQNIHWAQNGPSLRTNELRLGEVANREQPSLEIILYNETNKKYEPYKSKLDQVLPPLYFTSEQAAEIADLQKTIGDYVEQMLAKFVIEGNIDTNWDAYLKTLESMSLKKYLSIYQAAYDVKYKVKK